MFTLLPGRALEAVENLDPATYRVEGGERELFKLLDVRFPTKDTADELSEIMTKIFELKAAEGGMKAWISRASETFDLLQRKTSVAFPEEGLWCWLESSAM